MGTWDAGYARLEERIESLRSKVAEIENDQGNTRMVVDDLKYRLTRAQDELSRLMAAPALLSEEQVRKLVSMIQSQDSQQEDRKEFDRGLRISVVTMIVSVLAFSIIVPLIQHYLLR